MDNSAKRLSSNHSHHHHNRSIFLSKQRNFYGCQYSRRKSSDKAGASSFHVKSDEKVWLRKSSTQSDIDSSHQKVNKEKEFCQPERTRTSSSVADAASTAGVKLVCGLCKVSLGMEDCVSKNIISSGDLCVVAILVCGHVYHADCLERRTCKVDILDPPCPLCVSAN